MAADGPATKDEAIALVKQAVALIKDRGAQKRLIPWRSDDRAGRFVDRELYVEVLDLNGNVLADGGDASLVGKDQSQAKDIDGKPFVKERIELASKQPTFWQEYQYVNPVSKDIQPKRAYCERLNDTVVCGGVYTLSNRQVVAERNRTRSDVD